MPSISKRNCIIECLLGEKGYKQEFCKGMKFDNTTKFYIYKPEDVLEKKPHQVLLDAEI